MLFTIVLIIIVHNVDCQKIGSNEKFCIIFYEKPENWKDAIITCVDRKSELYVPYNDYESQQIQEISKAYQSDYIWINAYDESLSKDWHHHFNRYPVKYQGCFRNVANVTFQSSYENMNANECVNICREKYIYALFTDDEKCYCNSAYNNYMASDNCHDCQNLDECFRLYNTNGIPAKWESGQPNNYEGRQNCGAIVLTKFEAALVGDYYCNEKFRYICRKSNTYLHIFGYNQHGL
ncbi:hypothetical protein A3Q56_07261 [Intoshia linei]|uniref:C-type lectin domain-containing protein n=1 Tax=Intoshia linei TaxID=1819745 RepID=A0A177ASP9_9BILA|nr:hypothetical protein A3Q56_07261 [Intoshia linei]